MAFSAEEYFRRGLEKAQQGRLEEAIADWTEAINLEPYNNEVYYVARGHAKSDLGDHRNAILDFNEAISILLNHAFLYDIYNKNRSSFKDKEILIEEPDVTIKINLSLGQMYAARGLSLYMLGDNQGAIVDCDQAINLKYEDAKTYNNRGAAKVNLGNRQEAILDFNKSIDLDSNFAPAYANRGILKGYWRDPQGAILDFDKAIELDPNLASAYGGRGIELEEIGEIFQAQLDVKRFLSLTDKRDFFRNTRFTFRHFSTYPAPYLLYRSLQKFTDDFEQFNTVHPIVDATRQQCKPWKRWEEWRRLSGSEKAEPLLHYPALALVSHYMGDPIEAYRIYDDVLDDEEIMGVPLNLMGQYYFIESAKLFREPHEAILEFALQQIEASREELVARNALRALYYAGQIRWANDQVLEAHECFQLADDYLPAAYMQVLSLPAVGAEPAEIEAKIADIRAREAALPAEQSFLRGFPARPFRLEKPGEGFLAPILHYAHYREIAEAIAEVRRAGEPFEHHELWDAFYWLPEDEKELNWLIRREELAVLSRELLTQFKTNVAAQLEDRAAAEEMTLIEQAFKEVIKKDDWAGTKYADFEDFK